MFRKVWIKPHNYTSVFLFLTAVAIAFTLSSLSTWSGGGCVMMVWIFGVGAVLFWILSACLLIRILKKTDDDEKPNWVGDIVGAINNLSDEIRRDRKAKNSLKNKPSK